MKSKLTKTCALFALSLVLTSTLSAANYDDAQMRNLENRVSALEQRKGANGMINPPARPYVKDGINVFVTGDVLFWQANANGLGFAIENKPSGTFLKDARLKDPKFKWDFGFQAGLGYNLPHDGWDLYAEWTSFHTRATKNVSAPVGGTLFAVWNSPDIMNVDSTIQEAQAHWRLRMNVIDLDLGREFFVSKWLTLRPHVGFRTGWWRQKYRIKYFSSNIFGFAGSMEDTVKMRNRFWGLGLRAGLDTQWGLGCGWSIYGDASLALLRGNFRIDEYERIATLNVVLTDFRDRFQATRATADFDIGVRWDQLFCDDAFRLAIQAGWDHHMYWGQNQLKNFIDETFEGKYTEMNGDLAVSGFSLEMRFDF